MVLKEGVNEITYVGAQCSLRHTRVPARPTLPSSRSSHGSPTGSLGSSQLYSSEKPRDALNVTWKVSGGVRTRHTSPAPQATPCCYVHRAFPRGAHPQVILWGKRRRDGNTRARAHTPHTHSQQDQHSPIFSLSKGVTFAPPFLPSPALLSSQRGPPAILPPCLSL